VLVVEDDVAFATTLADYLRGRGMTPTLAVTLDSARQILHEAQFDAVVLDLNLGEHDGLVLARELAESSGPPVVIATSRIDESDRVLGLEIGADDYLVKPFSLRELLARLKAVMRRTRRGGFRAPTRRVARFDRWSLDVAALRLVDEGGREVQITQGEMTLLKVFLDHPDRVLLRNQILSLTRGSDTEVFERAIDVLVGRLRRKLEANPRKPRLIRTIRGEGYRFTAKVSWSVSAD
jgi:DNA-binding response OmpR family regulator